VSVKGVAGAWDPLLSKDAVSEGSGNFGLAKHGYFLGKQ